MHNMLTWRRGRRGEGEGRRRRRRADRWVGSEEDK